MSAMYRDNHAYLHVPSWCDTNVVVTLFLHTSSEHCVGTRLVMQPQVFDQTLAVKTLD